MAGINTYSVARMRHAIEQAPLKTNFGQDLSATLNAFKDFPFVETDKATITLKEMTESPKHAVQDLDDHNLEELLPRAASCSFSSNITSFTTRAGDGVAAPSSPNSDLLRVLMGGQELGTGTTITTGATARVLPCTDASDIAVGSAIACATGPGGTMESRVVQSKGGSGNNTLTLKSDLSGAPANGSVVNASCTNYLAGDFGDATEALQSLVQRLSDTETYLLLGGWLESIAFDFQAPGKFAKISHNWNYADFKLYNEAAADITGPLAFATYANSVPLIQADSQFRYQLLSATTFDKDVNIIDAPVIKIGLHVKYETHDTPGGVNNKKQPIRVRVDPVIDGSFIVPRTDALHDLWFGFKKNRTAISLDYQIGSSPTRGGALLEAPTCQVIDVNPVPQGDISALEVKWVGRTDSLTARTSKLMTSPFRYHEF
jgi:hypothetical protein